MKIHKRSTPETRRRLSVNLGVLFATLGIAVVVGLVAFLLHGFQMRRVSSNLLERAELAKEAKDWDSAAKFLEMYLLLQPTEAVKKVELAEVYDNRETSLGRLERLITLQAVAIGICETDPELRERGKAIRRRMVDRLMEAGRQEEALDEIARLAATQSFNVDLEKYFALCSFQLAVQKRSYALGSGSQSQLPDWLVELQSKHVPDQLQKALLDNPGDIELSVALAQCLLGEQDLLKGSQFSTATTGELRDRAMQIVDRMLSANRESTRAWLAHYVILSQIDRVAAESDIRQAISMAPDDIEVLRQAGIHYLERARSYAGMSDEAQRKSWLEQAAVYFDRVRENPAYRDVSTFLGYGDVLEEQGKTDEALKIWKDGARVCDPPTILLRFKVVDTLVKARRFDEALDALQDMEASIRVEGPALPRMYLNAFTRDSLRLWSTYYIAVGDYRAATNVLKQVVANNRDLERTDRAEIFAYLASAYFRMGKWDEAGANFEQAANLSSTFALASTVSQYHRGAATAWFSAQRFSEALKHLQAIDVKTAMDWIQIAETVLEIQMRQVPDASLWVMFDNALVDSRRILSSDPTLSKTPWVIDFLALESVAYRTDEVFGGAKADALAKDIRDLCERYPNADELWRRSISRLRSWGKNEDALALLEKLAEKSEESSEAAIARAEALNQDGMATEARRLLETRLQKDPSNESLKRALVQARAAAGEWENAMRDMNRVAGKDINIVRTLADMAVRTPVLDRELDLTDPRLVEERIKKWSDNVEVLEQEMREIEGDEGTEWKYLRGKRLLLASALKKDFDVSEVANLSSFLERNRPMWAATHVLAGNLAERQMNASEAIKSYNRALQYGEQSLEVYERLADLLYRQGALAEASALLDRLGNRSSRSRNLSSLALTINRNTSSALEFAKQGTDSRPNDPMAWVWYALELEVTSRDANASEREQALSEAKDAYKRANELSEGGDIRVLGAELNFYRAIGDQAKVDELIAAIRVNEKIDPVIKWVAIASISQTLGLMGDAEAAYDEALRAGGDKLEIGRRIAQLYLAQGRQDNAIEQLEKVYAMDPKDVDTKRNLATLLAARGTEEDWVNVEKLLSNEKGVSTADDRRLRAELLLQKGGPAELAQAQYLLETLVEDSKNRTDEDYFRLASVYLKNAKRIESVSRDQAQIRQLIDQAGKRLKQAASGSQTPPEYIYAYGDYLLQQERYQEALVQSERLSVAAPEEFSTALLKARVEAAGDRDEDAKNTIMTWLTAKTLNKTLMRDPKAHAVVLVQAGQAMDLLGQIDDAERLLREAFELDDAAGVNYVQSLSRSDDTVARNRAIKYLVEKVRRERTAGSAKLLANLLSAGRFDQELQNEGEEALLGIESANLEDADLLLAVADMWLAQNKIARAIETYRRIVKLKPGVVALNNLANLLAEQPGGAEEALKYIDQAIAIAGKQPLLLDTKGVILMLNDRLDEAIPIFETATRASEDPRLALHLYLALAKAGRVEEASRARGKINVEELSQTLLTPSERLELARLQQSVN